MKNIKGKSIAIFSSKGGTGKTTTVLNLAGTFSRLNKKVLIIDFDLYTGVIATLLNKIPNKTIYNFIDDYMNNRYDNFHDYVTPYNDNISFFASVKDPRQGSKIDPSYIELIIEKAVFDYDVTIIDMSHNLDEFNVTILDHVDYILTCVTNDLSSLKNAHNLVKIFNDAHLSNYRFILNEYINPNKNYYSLYDIKSIIKANIDYHVNGSFYLKSIDNYIANGSILTLENKFPKIYPKVLKTYMSICNDILEDKDEK